MGSEKKYLVGHSRPVFIIAEIGVNHNGSVELAHKLIDQAAQTGADAAKFQTFVSESMVSPTAAKADYQTETTGEGNQFDMLKNLELEESAWSELKQHCDEAGVLFMSAPFDEGSVDLLASIGVDVLKLGSGELTNRPLIEHCSLTGLPLIMSTGMADRNEVEAAISWFLTGFRRGEIAQAESRFAFEGESKVGVMHCVSSYPAPQDSLNLRAIARLREITGLVVGYSDHTQGIEADILAVAAGAAIIEKHMTLDCSMEGPDHRASIEPDEFKKMVERIRELELVLGSGKKEPHESELNVRDVARKSVVALRDIPKGKVIDESDVAIRRPGTGLAPSRLNHVLGRKSTCDIGAGQPLQAEWVDLAKPTEHSFF